MVKSPYAGNRENTGDFVWLGVWDDFRNWVGLGLEARETK
jgi:hypothetical protein